MPSLADALHEGVTQLAPSPTAPRDAELLLLHAARLTKADLLTHPERELTQRQKDHYDAAIARRARHEPVQYITGTQEFYGRPFIVNPLVLIPRPETEHLIETVLALTQGPANRIPCSAADRVKVFPLEQRSLPFHILDIGAGSGILAITLALELANATVTATDISPQALAVAQQNATALGAAERIRFLRSDLFAALPADQRYDCIVSNPPYVPSNDVLEPQVRDYEPATALYAGEDGLAIYRRLIPQAIDRLEPEGHLLLEIGHGQRDAVAALLQASGFASLRFVNDLQAIPRVAVAHKPYPPNSLA